MTGTSMGRSKRPGLAAVLSAVVPGAGQWYGGRARRAVLVFLPTLVLMVLVLPMELVLPMVLVLLMATVSLVNS